VREELKSTIIVWVEPDFSNNYLLMGKKIIKPLLVGILILWVFYLVLPAPVELPPLPQSLKSTEPGDTVQILGISAYYTNLSRQEVINFYQSHYSRSSLFNLPLITYRLNHPPEYFRELIRATQQVTYFEEIIHPLRESLFVSGFEWGNDPFTSPEKRVKNKLIINGREYKTKVTLIERNSNPIIRLIVTGGIVCLSWWLIKEAKDMLRK